MMIIGLFFKDISEAYSGAVDTAIGFALIVSVQTCFAWQVRLTSTHSAEAYHHRSDHSWNADYVLYIPVSST